MLDKKTKFHTVHAYPFPGFSTAQPQSLFRIIEEKELSNKNIDYMDP